MRLTTVQRRTCHGSPIHRDVNPAPSEGAN